VTLHGLSLWQPWSTLMAVGKKEIETRHYPPHQSKLGSDFAIHASRTFPGYVQEMCFDAPFYGLLEAEGFWRPTRLDQPKQLELVLPHGSVVAIARLAECAQVGQLRPTWQPYPGSIEHQLGDYAHGRWMWRFENIRALRAPVPLKGHQWVWPLAPDEERLVRERAA
jgi:hypothetical protein